VRRLFYAAAGAAVGVLVVRKVTRTASKWTPEGIAAQAGGAGDHLRQWWSIVVESAAEREDELRGALGIDDERETPAA
jgi:hypothetical protein